jgi:hypothetical protein
MTMDTLPYTLPCIKISRGESIYSKTKEGYGISSYPESSFQYLRMDERANRIVYVLNELLILTGTLLSCKCIQAKVRVIIELHNEFTNYYSSTYISPILIPIAV